MPNNGTLFPCVPAEILVNAAWEVGIGGNSKEIEFQKNRIHREKETIYQTLQEVPPNPKEPWDMEMDYDDTLTPEIPIEQLPDADADMADAPLDTHLPETQNPSVVLSNTPLTSSVGASRAALPEPDLELLAVLLKNPGLVFALAKGEAGLSNEDTVKVLDMLKSNGGLGLNGAGGTNPIEKVEVSLPSPTPHRNVEVSLPSPTPPNRFEVSLPSPTPSSNPGPVRDNVFILQYYSNFMQWMGILLVMLAWELFHHKLSFLWYNCDIATLVLSPTKHVRLRKLVNNGPLASS